MCKLIVHADDLGLSEKVNEGILHAHTHGILTSASIMANGSAFEHAIRICKSNPTLDVGIHLTLVEEEPVLNREKIPSLVNREGRFHHHAIEFIKRYQMGRIVLQEVHWELEAQIIKIKDSGINLSHIDSHQHLHMLPRILTIIVDLAKKFCIPAIRFPRETFHISMLWERGSFSKFLQLLVLNWFCRLGRYENVLRTDHFVGSFFSGRLNRKNLRKVIQHLPAAGTSELMCHPGLDDPNTDYGHWGYHWSEELDALIDSEISKILEQNGVHLISYRQVADL